MLARWMKKHSLQHLHNHFAEFQLLRSGYRR